MKNFNLCPLILCFAALVCLGGCAGSVTKLFPKQPRPFQEKKLDSKEWLDSDAQTRGEMAQNLYEARREKSSPNNLEGKTPAEVLQLLGKPDKKTIGKCCDARYAPDVEVWLYKLQQPNGGKAELEDQAVQIFFTEDGKAVEDFTLDEMEDKPVYIPYMG